MRFICHIDPPSGPMRRAFVDYSDDLALAPHDHIHTTSCVLITAFCFPPSTCSTSRSTAPFCRAPSAGAARGLLPKMLHRA
eukprot:9478715-Pyramimonas_sp.AAC.1